MEVLETLDRLQQRCLKDISHQRYRMNQIGGYIKRLACSFFLLDCCLEFGACFLWLSYFESILCVVCAIRLKSKWSRCMFVQKPTCGLFLGHCTSHNMYCLSIYLDFICSEFSSLISRYDLRIKFCLMFFDLSCVLQVN